jgi:dienelactone hydrolase
MVFIMNRLRLVAIMASSAREPTRYIAIMKRSLFSIAAALISLASLLASIATLAAPQIIDTEWKDAARERTLPIKVRVPDGDARVPLVIFSHGLGGSREGGKLWGEHWAANGYVVVHVQHPGSDETLWKGAGNGAPKERMARGATPEQLLGRVDDVRFVIDELTRLQARSDAPAWSKRIDLSRIAMTGHSFGALTTMALANERFPGPIKSVADPRISAFIAFSPVIKGAKKTWPERFGAMNQPFLTVTGTIDGDVLGNGADPKKRAAVFDVQSPGDKYRVVFTGGDHSVFNGGNLREAEWINWVTGEKHESTPATIAKTIQGKTADVTLKFLDAYLKGDAAAKSWLTTEAVKMLGDAGEWSYK